jgi:hypothetical protein
MIGTHRSASPKGSIRVANLILHQTAPQEERLFPVLVLNDGTHFGG